MMVTYDHVERKRKTIFQPRKCDRDIYVCIDEEGTNKWIYNLRRALSGCIRSQKWPLESCHYMQSEEDCDSSQPALDHRSEIQDLKKQIADLQSQLTRITQKDSRKAKSAARPLVPQTASTHSPAITHTSQRLQPHSRDANNNTSNRPRPWYCFRCGEDGHIKPQCESEPNQSLVAEKRKQLKEKQLAWDSQHGASKPDPLN